MSPHHRNVDISQYCHLLCEYLITYLTSSLLIASGQISPACLLHTTGFLSVIHFTGDEPKLRSRQREAGDAAVLGFCERCASDPGDPALLAADKTTLD